MTGCNLAASQIWGKRSGERGEGDHCVVDEEKGINVQVF